MGGYIRMDKDLEDDPRVADLGDLLAASVGIDKGLARDAVIGGLYRLWRHADTHLGRHNRLKGASHGPARISELTALPVSLVERFPAEWLLVHEDGTVELPDYAAKNALVDRDVRRANGRERSRRWREKKRKDSLNGDASHSVTAEASPRHQRVTTGTGTGTGPGTVPSETVEDPPQPPQGGSNGANAPSRKGGARLKRDASREAWATATIPIDHVRETARLPAELRLTWAYVQQQVDPIAWEAIQQVGGCTVIAERNRHTASDLESRFREAYEQRIRQERHT